MLLDTRFSRSRALSITTHGIRKNILAFISHLRFNTVENVDKGVECQKRTIQARRDRMITKKRLPEVLGSIVGRELSMVLLSLITHCT
jgi:hypothetical protein